jgi:hypothetical protein
MKSFVVALVLANIALAAWVVLSGPLAQTHEPSRLAMQLGADKIRLVSDTELERQRQEAARNVAAQPVIDLPRADCVLISGFTSSTMAHRVLTRLNSQVTGLQPIGDQADATELRLEGINDRAEAAIQKILVEFPRVSLGHCVGAATPSAKP